MDMEQRSMNAFGGGGLDGMNRQLRLAIARHLARIYENVLREPLPKSLQHVLEKLEERRR